MAVDRPRVGVYADLVDALLAAHRDDAGARFAAELRAGIESGEVTLTAAATLSQWQRAAAAELADHVRTVLPPVLAALDDSHRRHEAADSRATEPGAHSAVSKSESAASTPATAVPTSVEDRRRLIVAGLTTVRPDSTLDLTRAGRGEREA